MALLVALVTDVPSALGSDAKSEANGRYETLVIRGKVVDSEKKPLAGITVEFRPAVNSFETDAVQSAADGSFAIRFRAPVTENDYGLLLQAVSHDSTLMGVTRVDGEPLKQACDRDYTIELVPTKTVKLKVTDAIKRPIEGAHCYVGLDFPLDDFADADDDGTATFRVPANQRIMTVAAWKDNIGFDFRRYVIARHRLTDANAKAPEFPASGEESLVLDGASPFTIRVIDAQKRPVSGIKVAPWLLVKPSEPDYFNLSMMRRELAETTDANGTAIFHFLPTWQKKLLTFWLRADGYVTTRVNYKPDLHAPPLEVAIERLVPIRGRVTHADGSPVSSINIFAAGGGYVMDGGRAHTITDDNGNYELMVPPEQIYIVAVADKNWAAAAQDGFAVKRESPVENKDFVLRPATHVHGRLIDEFTKGPIANQTMQIYQFGKRLSDLPDVKLENLAGQNHYSDPSIPQIIETDANGQFDVSVGSGSFGIYIAGSNKWEKFEIAAEPSREIILSTRIPKKFKLRGTVSSGEPTEPISNALVKGAPQDFLARDWEAVTTAEGKFEIEIDSGAMVIQAMSPDHSKGAIIDVAADQQDIAIKVHPLGSVRGRLVEETAGVPVPSKLIEFSIQVFHKDGTFSKHFGGKVTTALDGTFLIDGLVQFREYRVVVPSNPDKNGEPRSWMPLVNFKLDSSTTTDLGNVILKHPPKPYVPPTLDERIATAFGVPRTPLDRFTRAKETAKLVEQRLVLVFGDPANEFVRALMKVRFEDKSYAAIGSDFLVAAIPTDSARRTGAKELAASIQESITDDPKNCFLVVFDQAGTKLKTIEGNSFAVAGSFSKDKFLAELKSLVPEPRNGQKLLDEALARAKTENKRVIVQETATWCGPCHQLSRYVDANRIWEKDYIWVRMDHRWTGATEIMEELRDGDNAGIPWIAILDKDGKVLTSFKPDDVPSPPGVDETLWRIERMIKSTSQLLTGEEVTAWVKGLGDSFK